MSDNDLDGWRGLYSGRSFIVLGLSRLAGTGTLSPLASATVIAAAVGKRASGSLAMLFSTTAESSGGMFGLMRAGGVGISLRCCIMIASGLSPRKGVTPVTISYRMIPSE